MGMVVQHNMNAINAYNKLNANVAGMKKSSEKLSSGYRINRAGDDAAGLAVSEKMRSQIKGLNQAIRNSQDGINMIQTFEGAAQESHSILQRMKELATQSANGTYDNATDRAAMQLEFNQLNDELNQIADTDFNGTIVLNGGVMADGLKEVEGDFDYANKKDQLFEQVSKELNDKLTAAQDELSKANNAFNTTKFDLSAGGKAQEWNTVDDNYYTKEAADALWIQLGLKKGATGAEKADLSQGTQAAITFEYTGDATNPWKAVKAEVTGGAKPKTITDETILGGITVPAAQAFGEGKDPTTDATGKGGIAPSIAGGDAAYAAGKNPLGNAIFDAYNVKVGDTVTLVYNNADPSKYAPTDVGINDDTLAINKTGTDDLTLSVALDAGLKDSTMTDKVEEALKALEDAEIKAVYGSEDNKLDSLSIGDATNIALDATNGIAKTTTGAVVKINGVDLILLSNAADKPKTIDVYAKGTDNSAANGTKLMTITLTAADTKAKTAGSVSGKISIEGYKYSDPADALDIWAGSNSELGTSNDLTDKIDTLKGEIADINAQIKGISDKAVDPKTGKQVISEESWKNIKEYLTKHNVSVADAFDNSTARLLYTEDITLQTGARSKDAVNFTFKYNQDDSVDMRGLEANLDISARANGLNTENLNIATADDANYAMDQIDKAINKVSMVRANFGAMQNRLEHKITNLTTTNENLTEAESSIRDTDMASEMMNYTKFNILQQAAQSMLAQANQQPQSILQLLG